MAKTPKRRRRSKAYLQKFHAEMLSYHVAQQFHYAMKGTGHTFETLGATLGLDAETVRDRMDDPDTNIRFVADVFAVMGLQLDLRLLDIPASWLPSPPPTQPERTDE